VATRGKMNLRENIIFQGNALDVLQTLPSGSVHCCVTSPPYYGLRDYGTAQWEGGDEKCDHIEKFSKHGGERADRDQTSQIFQAKTICQKCGAIRQDQQIGLEETPELYVEKLVEIFREVRRVLRDDGTLWLNLGDSYAGSMRGQGRGSVIEGFAVTSEKQLSNKGSFVQPPDWKKIDLKSKDLIGIPWMVAFALRADGWYLRADIIWHKPNPMPESVRDRPTKSHEYIFLMSKSAKYYYDNEAIKEKSIDKESLDGMRKRPLYIKGYPKEMGENNFHKLEGKVYPIRNIRSVWNVPTEPFKEAHFAVFPPKLIEPMIKAGCPEGGIILDPFAGSGTTGLVARNLGHNFILIELKPEYCEMARKRIEDMITPITKEEKCTIKQPSHGSEL
jgi:DNA modification methylase